MPSTRFDDVTDGVPPQEWFQLEDADFDVCHAHGLQLRAGESYTTLDDEIHVGPDSASELINIHISKTLTGTVLTLRLGHHGLIEQEIPMLFTPRLRASLRPLLHEPDGLEHP